MPTGTLLPLFMVIGLSGALAAEPPAEQGVASEVLILRERPGDLIRPLLDIDIVTPAPHWLPLKRAVEGLLRQRIDAGELTAAGVYFRDLTDGSWFGINETQDFMPASLLKVPCLIAAYKKAEEDPRFLSSLATFPADAGTRPQTVAPGSTLEAGRPYPMSEVLRVMIVESDNRAFLTAQRAIGPGPLNAAFTDLGLTIEKVANASSLSTREMAVFFRVLYNATYLGRRASMRALSLLTQTKFRDGLTAGVPKKVLVAHKFGEGVVSDAPVAQLHDCGIVYYPDLPYQLCVMTAGKELKPLAPVIRDVSSRVFLYIDAQFKGEVPARPE